MHLLLLSIQPIPGCQSVNMWGLGCWSRHNNQNIPYQHRCQYEHTHMPRDTGTHVPWPACTHPAVPSTRTQAPSSMLAAAHASHFTAMSTPARNFHTCRPCCGSGTNFKLLHTSLHCTPATPGGCGPHSQTCCGVQAVTAAVWPAVRLANKQTPLLSQKHACCAATGCPRREYARAGAQQNPRMLRHTTRAQTHKGIHVHKCCTAQLAGQPAQPKLSPDSVTDGTRPGGTPCS